MSAAAGIFEEYEVTKEVQRKIMDVMDKYRKLIADGCEVNHAMYENDIYDAFGGYEFALHHTPIIEYHFCEFIARAFMEDGRWEEVFPAIYGSFPKYGGKIN